MAWQALLKAFAKELLKKKGIEEASKQGTGDSNLGLILSALEDKNKETQPQEQFTRQPEMQYVQGPDGSMIGGQGEVMPGYDMQAPQPSIPQQYQGYGQQPQLPQQTGQRPDVGFMRGMINATTGQPQPEGLFDPSVSQGRRTAYYAGGLIPNIIMSKLGQPTPAEATGQQTLIEQRQNMANGQMVIDPETGAVVYTRPKGSVFKPESPEAKSEREITTATKKESNVRAGKLNELNKAINFFETKINEIPGGTGLGGRLQGMGLAIEGGLQTNPKVAAYMADIEGLRSQIARGLGEVGNLSEYEQKYASALLPKVTDNLETRQQKLKNFRDYIIARIGTQQSQPSIPQVGQSFNNEKVINVRRIE